MTHEVADIPAALGGRPRFGPVPVGGIWCGEGPSSAMLRPDGTYARARWTLSLIRDDRAILTTSSASTTTDPRVRGSGGWSGWPTSTA